MKRNAKDKLNYIKSQTEHESKNANRTPGDASSDLFSSNNSNAASMFGTRIMDIMKKKKSLNIIDMERVIVFKSVQLQDNVDQIYEDKENKAEIAAQDLFDLVNIIEELDH